MRKRTSLTHVSLILLALLLSAEIRADSGRFCYPTPPGIEGSRLDVPNEIVLRKVALGPKNRTGFIATEYVGSPNLQASVYLRTNEGYCLVGDFDGVTSIEIENRPTGARLFDIKTKSISGPDRFFRSYRFIRDRYRLADCYVKNENNVRRRCTGSEK